MINDNSTRPIRLGIMGFGHIGRYIFSEALKNDQFTVNAISDIGRLDILHYLLETESRETCNVEVQGNELVHKNSRTRFVHGVEPGDIPWDALDVDWVIDASGKYRTAADLENHIHSGAKKVILSSLPESDIDNIILPGINEDQMNAGDKIISAGSSTTAALSLILKILDDAFGITAASMTSIHSYTSDQPLQDTAGVDFRRSRSAAKNIIPNKTESCQWVEKCLPQFAGKLMGLTLNVPVQFGSLLDLNCLFDQQVSVEDINNAMVHAAEKYPKLIKIAEDPIVSSDVVGMPHSVVFDKRGTVLTSKGILKTLTWYDNGYNHAHRMLDVILAYKHKFRPSA